MERQRLFEESEEAASTGGVVLTVSGIWNSVDPDWAELALMVRIGSRWVSLIGADSLGKFTWLVARRRSGTREAPELTVVSALKKVLGANGVQVELKFHESSVSDDGTGLEFRYLATLTSKLTIALEVSDGGVRILGLE